MEELAKFGLEQSKKEEDEEGFEEISIYCLKFRINQVEEEWKAEKFNDCQIAHGMAGGSSEQRIKGRAGACSAGGTCGENQGETCFPGK